MLVPWSGGGGKAASCGPQVPFLTDSFRASRTALRGPRSVGLFTGASPKVNKTLWTSWSKVLAILDSGTSQIGLAPSGA